MPKLPVISGKQTVKRFERAGWRVARQRGSHVVMLKPEHIASLAVGEKDCRLAFAHNTLRAKLDISRPLLRYPMDHIRRLQINPLDDFHENTPKNSL